MKLPPNPMVTVFTEAEIQQQPVRHIADERLCAGALVSPRDRGAWLALELRKMSSAETRKNADSRKKTSDKKNSWRGS